MYVCEITYPGTWLKTDDRDWSWRIEGILRQLETPFTDAVVSLNLFESARVRSIEVVSSGSSHQQWETDRRRRSVLEQRYREKLGEQVFYESSDFIRDAIEQELKREDWSSGKIPEDYERRLPFIHAHSYLYAVDSFGKVLSVLAKEQSIPEGVVAQEARYKGTFGVAKHIRDSALHMEDRGRGLVRGKPLPLQPVDNELIHAPTGGVLILSSLNNNRLGYTLASGEHAEIEISLETLKIVQGIFQAVLSSFEWKGPSRHLPR